ncbi:hypothetical protein ACFS2C_08155 [Prauserella oleivorans]|uniref:DNA-binding transcriptional regulator of glucitol operon n=1 Tax=Prauserella oleivorans TaxID=1478153 RepID=A0ABW5WAM0_9PSEU
MTFSSTIGRRLAIAGLCVLSLVICCGLAWWQWDRFTSAGGTFQNLGYVLQWPLFGLFPAFMVWRYRKLSRRTREDRAIAAQPPAAPAAEAEPERRTETRPAARRQPVIVDAEDPEDEELAAYNRFLAELNARDQEVK